MKKKSARKHTTGLYLSLGLIIASVVYVFSDHIGNAQTTVQPAAVALAHPPVTTAVTGAKVSSGYRSGTYTGSSVNAYYGNVEVQATIQNGKIANVKFLQYPSDRSTSRSINGYATPILAQEAIAAQSAKVDTVSGATFTSEAFKQSLQSALSQA